MWRHALYAVCIVEAAVLAAILVVVVIQPDLLGLEPVPWVRRLCAWGALALMVGCAYGMVGWLRSILAGWARRVPGRHLIGANENGDGSDDATAHRVARGAPLTSRAAVVVERVESASEARGQRRRVA